MLKIGFAVSALIVVAFQADACGYAGEEPCDFSAHGTPVDGSAAARRPAAPTYSIPANPYACGHAGEPPCDFAAFGDSIPANQVKPAPRRPVVAPSQAIQPSQPKIAAPTYVAPPPKPFVQPLTPAFATERRVALIIGNSAYRSVPVLPNPRRDAVAVGDALRQAGFQVMVKGDLGRDTTRVALRAFRDAADTADWALIYYAGHGFQIGGVNYLVPVDAVLHDERDVDGETVSYSELEKTIGNATALRIIILDACRTDPFQGQMARLNGARAVARGLSAPPESRPGLLVVYSAKDGQIAEDGDGDHSPFAAALLAHLKDPGREVRRMFDDVSDDVLEATKNHQQPFTYGRLPGKRDFFFVAAK